MYISHCTNEVSTKHSICKVCRCGALRDNFDTQKYMFYLRNRYNNKFRIQFPEEGPGLASSVDFHLLSKEAFPLLS